MTDDVLQIADELYSLPLPEFTVARDAKAKELKGTPLAAPVKKLRKPSTAAWVVNLLVRHESEQVDQILSVGAALREAQAAMSAAELRELTKQRRQLTAAVTTRARALAREHGLRVSEDVAEQVEGTLTAAMIDERCAAAVRSGLLVSALSTTGVDEVDVEDAVALGEALGFAATPRSAEESAEEPTRPDLHVVPDPDADAKARAAAEERLAEAEEALEEAQGELEVTAAEVENLQARGLQIQAEIDELKRRLSELESAYDELDDELSDAEEARSEAEEAVRSATSARDAAAAALAKLQK